MHVIETSSLSKEFNGVQAVDSLDISVEEGEIYGFLGPNGAGKSTTINMLLGFVYPTSGSFEVLGLDGVKENVEIRRSTGVVPENYSLYGRLTGYQHLEFAVDSKDADVDIDKVLERVGLDGDGERRVGGYSKGMQKRLVLGMALIGDPDILILDEPTSGLDPNGARDIREIVREENERGATVFFSSHILEQVEKTCDKVGILDGGELVAQGGIEDLREKLGGIRFLNVEVDGSVDSSVIDELGGIEGVVSVDVDDESLSATCTDTRTRYLILERLEESGYKVMDFRTEERSLDEVFEEYVGE